MNNLLTAIVIPEIVFYSEVRPCLPSFFSHIQNKNIENIQFMILNKPGYAKCTSAVFLLVTGKCDQYIFRKIS